MKLDAISNHEQALIIQQLANTGNWQAARMGAVVRMVRYQSPVGCVVQWSVRIGKMTVSQQAGTVAEAVREVNGIIRGRQMGSAPNRHSGSVENKERNDHSKRRQRLCG